MAPPYMASPFMQPGPTEWTQPYPAQASRDSGDIEAIHRRLDGITASLQRLSQPAYRPEERRTPPQPSFQSPPTSPAPLDLAIAEITARQNQLNTQPATSGAAGSRPQQPFDVRAAMGTHHQAPPSADLSGIERKIQALTGQIEAMRRADAIEPTIAAFRNELAEIRRAVTEALPRQAIESLENEIRSIAQRIGRSREAGNDDSTLDSIERALNDIYGVVRTLTPAEQLGSLNESIRNLGGKIDLIVQASQVADESLIKGGIEQLENSIGTLRDVVSHVASSDAIEALGQNIGALAQKVDQIAAQDFSPGSFGVLEQRIAQLTATLESRAPQADSGYGGQIEAALHALSERIDHLQAGQAPSELAHLEQRITMLLERIESMQSPSDMSGRLEHALSEILTQLGEQRAHIAALQNRPADGPQDDAAAGGIRRELDDIRQGQSQTDRRLQDSIEVLHNTLGHIVDRLGAIETDIKEAQVAPSIPSTIPVMPTAAPSISPAIEPEAPPVSDWRAPELPNPAASRDAMNDAKRSSEPAQPTPPRLDQIELSSTPLPKTSSAQAHAQAPQKARTPIDATLPPDFPIEPGEGSLADRRLTASERIAASESDIGRTETESDAGTSKSDFIAAARRAAAAAAAQSSGRPPKGAMRGEGTRSAETRAPERTAQPSEPSRLSARIKSLLVGASVVVIVLGTLKMAVNLFEASGTPAPMAETKKSSALPPSAESSASTERIAVPSQAFASTPIASQPMAVSTISSPEKDRHAPAERSAESAPSVASNGDITGSVQNSKSADNAGNNETAQPETPYADTLPAGIGGPALRAAALKGDPAAAYEIGTRFAEGKGVSPNYNEAAIWYERAAEKGVAMAAFRLGTFYEKGLGPKKNPETARRYYMMAAERGNAKAMHNLAVLDADGGGKSPDYKSASVWFRKAANYGVADSQYNLGILYARGIGVEQNLAESFKWFSLAAAQGDVDAGRKRDDVAKRLDAQSQAAARLAVQTFIAEPQPTEATTVAAPPGGWDPGKAAQPTKGGKRSAKNKSAATRRASR